MKFMYHFGPEKSKYICCTIFLLFFLQFPSTLSTENYDDTDQLNSTFEIDPEDTELPLTKGNSYKEKLDSESAQPLFTDINSQNSGIPNEEITSGQIVIPTKDIASVELEKRANIPDSLHNLEENISQSVDSVKENDTEVQPNNIPFLTQSEIKTENITEDLKIDATPSIVSENATIEKTEEIPSFSEWAQKRLEEAEKSNEQVSNTSLRNHTSGKTGVTKHRSKNYASLDCGAKVIAANPEAGNPSAVLSPSRGGYGLNTCTSKIWFIVELCEAIQANKIELANFELFSSSPKDFTISISDRFPTREWLNVGQFTAKDERTIQSFELQPQLFGKYVKVEIKTHHGSEHFCPISLFRVYGTSEFEVLQKEDSFHAEHLEEDDDDDELNVENGESSKNLFSSATDAVISIVKKAAEVLGNKSNTTNSSTDQELEQPQKPTPLINVCTTPSHLVVCNNCSDILFGQVYELLSCKGNSIKRLVDIPVIARSLYYTDICQSFGLKFRIHKLKKTPKSAYLSIKSFFSRKVIGAMCNTIAIKENKVALNVTQTHQYPNVTDIKTDENNQIDIQSSKLDILESGGVDYDTKGEPIKSTEELNVDVIDVESSRATCSTETSYGSQIKPTKTTSHINIEDVSTTTESDVKVSSYIEPSEVPNEKLDDTFSHTNDDVSQASAASSENPLDTLEVTSESSEGIEDHLDQFMPEFTGDQNQNNGNHAHMATTPTPQIQKESVFLRLSNRIKALERNMSLSSQYLEELSRRYKKQVEEMQRLLEKTLNALNEESKNKEEKYRQLEEKFNTLTLAVESLISERNKWKLFMQWLIFISFLFFCAYTFCNRRRKYERSSNSEKQNAEIQRRKSVDVIAHSQTANKKKRRPSDQALKIVRSSILGSDNEENEKRQFKERKKKKKKNMIKRSNSVNVLNEEVISNLDVQHQSAGQDPSSVNNWVEGTSLNMKEIPIVLDESEHSTLEELPVEIDNIDVPVYLKTAKASRMERISLSGPIQLNGNDTRSNVTRKSVSLDESKRSPVPSVNGASSSTDDQRSPKKERKGFKKLFKRVF